MFLGCYDTATHSVSIVSFNFVTWSAAFYFNFSLTMLNETLADAEFYSESIYLRVMLAVRTPLLCVAITLLIILHLNRHKFVAHRSLAVLLNCHMFWTLAICITSFIDHFRKIFTLVFMKSPYELIYSDNMCLLKTAPQCLAIYASVCSLFMMSFERYTASTNLSTYEKSCKNYGYKLATGHLIIAIPFTLSMVLTYGSERGETAYCSIKTPKGEIHHQICALVLMVQEVWTIIAFRRLLRMNEALLKSTAKFSLTERYQIAENLRMIRIVLPVVWSHVLITLVAAPLFLAATLLELSSRYFPLFEDSINLLFLQGIFMPFFFLRQFRMDTRRNQTVMDTNTATGEALTATHSAAVQAAWTREL